jgi:hypothetical protein
VGCQEPLIESGTFYYDSGASYEGEFTMMLEGGKFFVPPAEEGEVEDTGKKAPPKAEEEVDVGKPPVRVRQVPPLPHPATRTGLVVMVELRRNGSLTGMRVRAAGQGRVQGRGGEL